MPAQAAGAPPQPPRYTMMDVETLSGANELYHEGPHARQRRRRWRSGAAGERRVYIAKARTLDHEHSRQADGTRYPGVREQVQGHLVGPVLAALRAWDPMLGLVVWARTRAAARRCTVSTRFLRRVFSPAEPGERKGGPHHSCALRPLPLGRLINQQRSLQG